ncbi:cytochrome P450 94B3 [Amborella trichopoda]|uniref:Cytochrome P450 n=1 Tax=Amborella trichopoda TaxID=13333 RepID=W1PJ05_AMBTC|nr:cytochrome P450 94B3 [Amborella trichopoda]ERN09972.1 hypothetical protein AMTR_s00013p00215200 [Amborella trichopoda]|eukprot:XP_006848391.1 cytochrome P450 94B3 [Amborella trichopoda]
MAMKTRSPFLYYSHDFFYLLFPLLLPVLLLSLSNWLRKRSLQNRCYGPRSYPLVGCMVAYWKNQYRLLDWYTELLADSPGGTIVVQRLGAPRTVVTANPANVEYMLSTQFSNFPKGKPFTEVLGDLLGHGIFNTDGELWHTQRKVASPEFATSHLRRFVLTTLRNEIEGRLLPILRQEARSSTVLDLQDVFKRFTFDSICLVSFGMYPGCLEVPLQESRLAKAFDIAAEISARRGAATLQAIWKIKRALNLGSERKLKEAVGVVREAVAEIVREQAPKGGDHLLARLLRAGLGEELARDMVVSFIMAGRDTTSAALTWLFWLLARHTQAEREVIREAQETTTLDYQGLMGLKYLHACLCETMRLYPPVAWDSKHAARDDVLPDGTGVTKGCRITYFPYGMGRTEGIWGKDWAEFRPERWLEGRIVSAFEFPVFQGGPRQCLGKEMAFLQMKYVAASVLKEFRVVLKEADRVPLFVPLLTACMGGGGCEGRGEGNKHGRGVIV